MHPSSRNSLLPLALEYHRAGQLDQADDLYHQLTSDLPSLAQIVYLRGLVAHQRDQHEVSLHYARQASILAPDNPSYWNLVGVGHFHLGQVTEAIEAYEKSLQLNPQAADTLNNLCLARIQQGRFPEAVEAGQLSYAYNPANPEASVNLGHALARTGRLDEAEAMLRKGLELDPSNVNARRNLGHVLKEQGRFDEARAAYEHLLRDNPRDGRAFYSLAQIKRFQSADLVQCYALEALSHDERMLTEDRSYLHFALGKMYEDCGVFDRAFRHYQAGNELQRSDFDRISHIEFVDRTCRYFTPDRFAQRAGQGHPSPRPVFVIGMFRSGTSLVEQILASHPEVYGCGELSDVDRYVNNLPYVIERWLPYPDGLNALSAEQLFAAGENYLAQRDLRAPQASRLIDKMPKNFLHLGLIAQMFPNARVIHCRREPRDVCWSIYATSFASRPSYSHHLSDIGFFYREYERLMNHWRSVLPLPMLEVSYEELVQHQERVSRQMLDFIGLPWNDACLRFHETPRPVQTASDWQVRQPIYTGSIGRWRSFAPYLQPLLAELDAPQRG